MVFFLSFGLAYPVYFAITDQLLPAGIDRFLINFIILQKLLMGAYGMDPRRPSG